MADHRKPWPTDQKRNCEYVNILIVKRWKLYISVIRKHTRFSEANGMAPNSSSRLQLEASSLRRIKISQQVLSQIIGVQIVSLVFYSRALNNMVAVTK